MASVLSAICGVGGYAIYGEEASRTWADTTGKFRWDGVFLKLADEVVHLRLPDGKVARIPLAKLSPDDQVYARSAASRGPAEEDPFDTSSTMPAEPGTAAAAGVSGGAQLGAEQDPSVRVVVAEGVGVDVESAKSDAYRQAVRQVVGAFVDASTMVENDTLIEDQVITLSSGFVEKAEPVSESKSGGLVRMRVRASVRLTKLLDTLNANRIATASVDTDSLVARVVTTADQQQGFEAILAKQLLRFHEQCFAVSAVGQPAVGKASGDSVEVRVKVAFSPNKDAYMALASKLATALDATPRKHGEIISDGMRAANKADYKQVVAGIREYALNDGNWGDLIEIFADRTELEAIKESVDREGNSSLIKYDPLFLVSDPTCTGDSYPCGISGLRYQRLEKLWNNNGTGVLILLVKSNDSFQRTQWRWFHLSKDEVELVRTTLRPVVRCTVRLLDQKGEEITRDVLRLKQFGVAADTTYPTIIVSPFFVHEDMKYYVPTVMLDRTLALQKSEISAVGRAEVMLSEEIEP
jgi:hypothetical protein